MPKLKARPRRPPQPSPVGDDPCFQCGKPGSTCGDCGEVICDVCNVGSGYLLAGHEPAAHLDPPPPHVETEIERLIRENRELELQLRGTVEDRLRKRNEELRAALAKVGES
jgi:hypothetical protein